MPDAPLSDAEVPAYWRGLGLPGLADIHIHFLPERMQRKVWSYFDRGASNYGTEWPIHYRYDEAERLRILRELGVRAIPSLLYPHKPGMAAWLNDWATEFAARVPEAVHTATLFPEPETTDYVRVALERGARLVKVHVQVGGFDPSDPLLDQAWGMLAEAGTPIVIHAGSRPLPGEHTGPAQVADVLARHPRLTFVIAHLGMHEYGDFADLAAKYRNVHLDTTMAGTDFTEKFAPMPPEFMPRLADLGDKIVLGSDFPTIPHPYAHQIEALHRFGFGPEWMRAVLWDNGARLLGLTP